MSGVFESQIKILLFYFFFFTTYHLSSNLLLTFSLGLFVQKWLFVETSVQLLALLVSAV